MTPMEFAGSLGHKHPELIPVREITELYYRDRYAPRPLTAEEEEAVKRLVDGLMKG